MVVESDKKMLQCFFCMHTDGVVAPTEIDFYISIVINDTL